jgi:HEAT repeat protein
MGLVRKQVSAKTTDAAPQVQGVSPTVKQLTLELRSTDSSVRRQAARALAPLAETALILATHLQSESAISVRSIIFTGLTTHPSAAAVEGLLPFLRSEDVALRNGTIEALQRMPELVLPFMDSLLADGDSDVRIMAVNVLGMLHHPAVPERLMRVVAEDAHINVCSAALDALVEVGGLDAIPVLEHLAKRFADVAFMQFAVAAAIQRIRGG